LGGFRGDLGALLMTAQPSVSHAERASAAAAPHLYVSFPSGEVDTYRGVGHGQDPIGALTGLASPGGLAVDRDHNLWVYEKTGIAGFRRGGRTPFITLKAPPGFGIAVDRTGTIYAATSTNVIDVFVPGSTVPTRQLVDPSMYQLLNVAVDDAGDVFCNGYQLIGSGSFYRLYFVDEFPARSSTPLPVRLRGIGAAAGLAVGANATLIVQEPGLRTISVYEQPYTGNPISTIHYAGALYGAFALALTSAGSSVWTVYLAPNNFRTAGVRYDLFTGRKISQTALSPIRNDAPNGIAIDPGFEPG
jgi:hypothetical protein